MCDIVVVGGAMTDYSIRGDRLPRPGESAQGYEFHVGTGGKGANAAVAAARLGARVALITALGADAEAERIRAKLRREGVRLHRTVQVEDESTGATVIQVDRRGRKQTLSRPGAVLRITPDQIESAHAEISTADVLLCQLEAPVETIEAALRIGRGAAVNTVLDAAPARPLPDRVLAGIGLLCANSAEAEVLTGISVDGHDSASEAAQVLLERGCEAVAISAGSSGTLVATGADRWWLPALNVEVRDTTGAGDAFAAAAAVCLGEGSTLQQATRFANAASALATVAIGAQSALPDRAAVMDMLAWTGDGVV